MLQRIALEVALIVILVVANGVFAMSEIALVTSRKARLQQLARRGSARAEAALRLAANPDRFLSTVQIGITLIGVFAGAFGGATIADQIDEYLETIPGMAAYSEAVGVGTVVIGITFLSLVLGELVPKRIAMNSPERIATLVAGPMRFLARIAAPAVYVLTASTRLVLGILRIRESKEPAVTEEELRAMLLVGTRAGTIEAEEREIIERTFRLGDRRVAAVMTPRVDLEWLDSHTPLEQLRRQVAASSHEWFPIAEGRVDALSGVVRGRDLWTPDAERSPGLTGITTQPLIVPETISALSLLQRFRETRNHLAIVVDEFGGVEGLVTPTDILEALVGELPAAGDLDEPSIVSRPDGSISVDAATDLEEVRLKLGLDVLEGQKEGYQTIGGYLVERLSGPGRIGDVVETGEVRFEVLDTDGRRIDRVLVSRIEPHEQKPA